MTEEKRHQQLAFIAAAVTVILWASGFVGIRYAGTEISAGALALIRQAIGCVLLGLILVRRGWTRPHGNQWWLLLLCGITWFGLYGIALNEAERHMDAGIAAMLVNVGPIIIIVLAGIFLKEGFPGGVAVGSLVSFAGVVVIALSGQRGAQTDYIGIALCVAAAFSYAIGVVSQKPVLRDISAITVTWLACTIGMIVCLPFAPALVHDLSHAHLSTIASAVYLGVFPTSIAFTTWAYALAWTPAGRMGATTYIVPPLTVVMGWGLLGEQPHPLALVGGFFCLLGVYVARRRWSRR